MQLIQQTSEKSVFETKFTTSGTVVMILLTIALIILSERVLYDVARILTVDSIGSFGYFDNVRVIWAHVMVVIPILVINLLFQYIFGERKQQYAVFLLPYFITSIIVTMQLVIQLGYYFAAHHNNFQFYTVMSLLVIISSVAIYFIQKNYQKERTEDTTKNALIVCMVLLIFFAVIILKANDSDTRINSTTTEATRTYPSTTEGIRGDTTPRIMYWYGRVNQHWDIQQQMWRTDDDGTSGANLNKLEYCRKFYPQTKSVQPYRQETISTWHDAGNQNAYTYTTLSDLCVQ